MYRVDLRLLGLRSKVRFNFSPLVGQSSPNLVDMRRRNCSLQVATPFSVRCYLVSLRRYSRSGCEDVRILPLI